MGPGDAHGCSDIGLVENVNCRFIEGQGLDIGRPLLPSFGLGAAIRRTSIASRPASAETAPTIPPIWTAFRTSSGGRT